MRRLAWCLALLCISTPAFAQRVPDALVAAFEPDPSAVVTVRTSDDVTPSAFALGPSRWLLANERVSEGELWLLEGTHARPLGRGGLESVPGFGRVVRTLDESGGGRGRVTLWGVHPTAPRLVALFRGALGARPQVIGQSQGALVIVDAIGDRWTITRIRPGAPARVTHARGDFTLSGPDAVRGAWALALPVGNAAIGVGVEALPSSPPRELRRLNIETGQLLSIGLIEGCTEPLYTAMPGSRVAFYARFADGADYGLLGGCVPAVVDPSRMALVPQPVTR